MTVSFNVKYGRYLSDSSASPMNEQGLLSEVPRCDACTGANMKNRTRKELGPDVLCCNRGGNHPGQYKGCRTHKELKNKNILQAT